MSKDRDNLMVPVRNEDYKSEIFIALHNLNDE